MKKKLFFLLCALLTSVGMWAEQYDVTAKYLTNPSFETGDMTGWQYLWDNKDHTSIPFAAFGKSSSEYEAFSSGGGTAADGNYIAKMGATSWCDKFTIYQASSVTLPAGSYKLTANLQSNANLGTYHLGVVSGSVSSEATDVTFLSETTGSFANAWTGTIYEREFTLADNTDVTFAAQSFMWGVNHEFCVDDFRLYRMEDDVTITNPGFDDCTAETSDVAAKTIKDYSSKGWTNAATGSYTTIAVTAYGGGKKVGNSTTPTTKKDGTTVSGNTLGIIAGWGDEVKIQSGNITLSAPGVYTFTVDHYLSPGDNINCNASSSRSGFVTESTSYLVSSTTFTTSTWTTETVTFTLTESTTGKIQVGLKGTNSKGSGANAVFYDDVKLTYSPFADDSDYAILNAAISFVEGQTWGFGVGEYAPYNNKGVLKDLADAKALNQEGNNSRALVLNLAATLTGATYTANAEEVNAIWDGSFAYSYSHDGNVQPFGWTGGSGHDNATDVRYQWNVDSNPGLAATTNSTALFTKYDAYYGKATGYTMPLKAHTMYKLTFKYGTWGTGDDQTRGDGYIQMKDGSSNTITVNPSNSLTLTADERGANANMEKWKNFTGYFTTTEAGNYVLDLLKTTTSQQNQYVYGDFSLVRATASEAKPYLLAEITNATGIYNSGANVGTGVFQITEEAGDDFVAAIATAQAVYDNGSATADDVMDAIDDLKAAEETFVSTLNAPDPEKRYCIVLNNNSEWTYDGKAMTYLANDRADMGLYNIKYQAAPNSNYAQAFILTQVTGNTYKMSQIDVDGNTRYICTGVPYSGNTGQIRTTTDASKALIVRVTATSTEGVFNIYNTEASNYIGSQDAGVYTVNKHINFTIQEATQATPNLTVAANVNWATFMSPFAVSLSSLDDVTAFRITGVVNDELTTEEVSTTIPANTPVLLYRKTTGSNYAPALSGYGTAYQDNYTEGLLTGSFKKESVDVGKYLLQKNGGIVAFYVVPSSPELSIGAYRAYLTMPAASARPVIYFPGEDGPTAINAIGATEAEGLKDGKYLVKGRIVIVKNGKAFSANGLKLK